MDLLHKIYIRLLSFQSDKSRFSRFFYRQIFYSWKRIKIKMNSDCNFLLEFTRENFTVKFEGILTPSDYPTP